MFVFCNFFILKCAKVVVSLAWLVIAIEFVIVCHVDRRTFIFFSSDSIGDFRCESLILFTFYVSCQVSSRSNERELDRLLNFAFSNDSLDLLWIYLNRLINVQLPLDMRFIKWSKAGFDQWKRSIWGCVSGLSNKVLCHFVSWHTSKCGIFIGLGRRLTIEHMWCTMGQLMYHAK